MAAGSPKWNRPGTKWKIVDRSIPSKPVVIAKGKVQK